jgi:hypothetical protein
MLFRFNALLLLCSIPAMAQDPAEHRVALRLIVNDESKDVLKSPSERKLRGLNDLVVVDRDPRFILRAVGIETQARRCSKLRLAFAYGFAALHEDDLAPLFDPEKLPPEAARKQWPAL